MATRIVGWAGLNTSKKIPIFGGELEPIEASLVDSPFRSCDTQASFKHHYSTTKTLLVSPTLPVRVSISLVLLDATSN